MHSLFLYNCYAHLLYLIQSILEYLGNYLSSFKDDRHGRDHTDWTETNMCYFLREIISTILSVLFVVFFLFYLQLAIEACYTIKENNKEKSFCRGKLPFCRFAGVNYHSAGENREEPIFPRHFLLLAQITRLSALIEETKTYFVSAFSCQV